MKINSTLIKKIALKHHLPLIYLFGSQATGRDSEKSDVDIAVYLNRDLEYNIKDLLLDLIYDLSKILHTDKIDLVILNQAPLALQYNVISEGKVIYQSNPETRYEYEMNVVTLYLDFKKYEDDYYNYMHKQILEG